MNFRTDKTYVCAFNNHWYQKYNLKKKGLGVCMFVPVIQLSWFGFWCTLYRYILQNILWKSVPYFEVLNQVVAKGYLQDVQQTCLHQIFKIQKNHLIKKKKLAQHHIQAGLAYQMKDANKCHGMTSHEIQFYSVYSSIFQY